VPFKYDVNFTFTGLLNYTTKKLCVNYKMVGEIAKLYIYNGTAWNFTTNLSRGAITTAYIDIADDEYDETNGNVTFRITEQGIEPDTSQDELHIYYAYVHADMDVKLTCEFCHHENKHDEHALGIPLEYNGTNVENQSISSGNWCAGCHWQGYESGDKTYDDAVKSFETHSRVVPPEISGNGTYKGLDTANDGETSYENHTPEWVGNDYNDSSCWFCHGGGVPLDAGMTAFTHNVSIGQPYPRIYDWTNSKTNDTSLDITVNESEDVTFRVWASQTINYWNWTKDGDDQGVNYDNITLNWPSEGSYYVSVNGTNTNGTSDTKNWSVTVETAVAAPTLTLGNVTDITQDWGRTFYVNHSVTVTNANANNVSLNYSYWLGNKTWASITKDSTEWWNNSYSNYTVTIQRRSGSTSRGGISPSRPILLHSRPCMRTMSSGSMGPHKVSTTRRSWEMQT